MRSKGKWYCPSCDKWHIKVVLGACPICGKLCRYFYIQERPQRKIQWEK